MKLYFFVLSILLSTAPVVSAQITLPYATDFENQDGFSDEAPLSGVWTTTDTSIVTADDVAQSGTQSVRITSANPENILSLRFNLDSHSVLFADYYMQLTASALPNLPSLTSPETTAIVAVFPYLTNSGEWAFLNGDGLGSGTWFAAGQAMPLDGSDLTSWHRITLRFNLTSNLWDAYIDGSLLAVNLGFVEALTNGSEAINIYGNSSGVSYLDTFSLVASNPLFADADSDGIPDTFESSNGLNPSVDDRDLDLDSDGLTNVEEYIYQTDPSSFNNDEGFLNGILYNRSDWYIDAVNGDDTTGTGSQASPLQSLPSLLALNKVNPIYVGSGDTIYFAAGDYSSDSVTIDVVGLSLSGTLDANGESLTQVGNIDITADNVALENLHFNSGNLELRNVSGTLVTNNTFTGSTFVSLTLLGASNNIISQNYFGSAIHQSIQIAYDSASGNASSDNQFVSNYFTHRASNTTSESIYIPYAANNGDISSRNRFINCAFEENASGNLTRVIVDANPWWMTDIINHPYQYSVHFEDCYFKRADRTKAFSQFAIVEGSPDFVWRWDELTNDTWVSQNNNYAITGDYNNWNHSPRVQFVDRDGNGSSVEISHNAGPQYPSNTRPFVQNSIADVSVEKNAADIDIDLYNAFEDSETVDESLNFTIDVANPASDPNLVSYTLNGGTLTLSFSANSDGSSSIVVTAQDDNSTPLNVNQMFSVVVNAVTENRTNWYIDAVNGDDLMGTGSQTSPFRSLSSLLALNTVNTGYVGNGDTIHFAAGDYSLDSVTIDITGLSLSGTLDTNGEPLTQMGNIDVTADTVTLKNFNFNNKSLELKNANSVLVTNNTFTGTAPVSLSLLGASNNIISHNYFGSAIYQSIQIAYNSVSGNASSDNQFVSNYFTHRSSNTTNESIYIHYAASNSDISSRNRFMNCAFEETVSGNLTRVIVDTNPWWMTDTVNHPYQYSVYFEDCYFKRANRIQPFSEFAIVEDSPGFIWRWDELTNDTWVSQNNNYAITGDYNNWNHSPRVQFVDRDDNGSSVEISHNAGLLPSPKTPLVYSVIFDLDSKGTRTGGGELSQNVTAGEAAIEPIVGANRGFIFAGWNMAFDNVINDSIIIAQFETDSDTDDLPDDWELVWFEGLYESGSDDSDGDGISNLDEYLNGTDPAENTFLVTFDLDGKGTGGGDVDLTQVVTRGSAAVAPTVAGNTGFYFTHWDVGFDNVQSDLVVTAQYFFGNLNHSALSDYDFDGLNDAFEIAEGLDPLTAYVWQDPTLEVINGGFRINNPNSLGVIAYSLGDANKLPNTESTFNSSLDVSLDVGVHTVKYQLFFDGSPVTDTFSSRITVSIPSSYPRPDRTPLVSSQTVYYGRSITNSVLGAPLYSTNQSDFSDPVEVGYGVVGSPNSFAADFSVDSRTIYYGKMFYDLRSGAIVSDDVYSYRKNNLVDPVKMGKGWITSKSSFIADVNQPSQDVFYGRNEFNYDGRAEYIYSTESSNLNFNAFPVGKGWLTSKGAFIADMSESPRRIYYARKVFNERTVLIYTYSTLGVDNEVLMGEGWITSKDGFIPDTEQPSRTIYYGPKTYPNGARYPIYSYFRGTVTWDSGNWGVDVGKGWITSKNSFIADTSRPSRKINYARKYWQATRFDDLYTHDSPSGDDAEVGRGWIISPSKFLPDYSVQARPTYYGDINLGVRPHDSLISLYTYNRGDVFNDTLLGYGWIKSISGWLNSNYLVDSDGDGLFVQLELQLGTSDSASDTDGDGISDYDEFKIHQTDPLNWDTDNDLLADGIEIRYSCLDPLVYNDPYLVDTQTGLTILKATQFGFDICEGSSDFDSDGLHDILEIRIYGTTVGNQDSDSDNMLDGEEVANGLNPLINDAMLDLDGDHYPNVYELRNTNGNPSEILNRPQTTYNIPADYSTIQSAIDAVVNPFSIIVVEPGTYLKTGNSDFTISNDDPPMMIISREGAVSTILDGENVQRGAQLKGNQSALVGFTIRNCVGSAEGGGILIEGENALVAQCEVYNNNAASQGGGIYNSASDVQIQNTLIYNNRATTEGGGIYFNKTEGSNLLHTTLYNNAAPSGNEICINEEDVSDGCLINSIVWNGSNNENVIVGGALEAENCIITESSGYSVKNTSWVDNNDPLLTPNGRLTADSIAIDRLANSSSLTDIDGDYRPHINYVDIGADEVVGSTYENGDADSDGLRDWWEVQHFTDITQQEATDDTDADSLNNIMEFLASTSPSNVDTDGDGLEDGIEVNNYNTSPLRSDTDNDSLGDDWEIEYGFNPTVTNSADKDSDGDGVLDGQEYASDGNPWVADTDGDGMPDIFEYSNDLNLTVDDRYLDEDNDGLSNYEEYIRGTQANYFDSDGDLLSDGWEVEYGMDPLVFDNINDDADSDGIDTFDEYRFGANPFLPDTDGDGISDGVEINRGSNSNDSSDNGQAPDQGDIQEVSFSVGDPSGSRSERWEMVIQGLGPDTRQLKFSNRDFGTVGTDVFKLWKDSNYRITLRHNGTNIESPDYDWEATIDGQPTTDADSDQFFNLFDNWIVDNSSNLLSPLTNSDAVNSTLDKEAFLLKVDLEFQNSKMSDWKNVKPDLSVDTRIGVIRGDKVDFRIADSSSLLASVLSWSGEKEGTGDSISITFDELGKREVTLEISDTEIARVVVTVDEPTGVNEAGWLLAHPSVIGSIHGIRNEAEQWVQNNLDDLGGGWTNGRGDAARHAYWSGIMTLSWGEDYSEGLGTAHEVTGLQSQNADHNSTVMDLENNAVGRSLAPSPMSLDQLRQAVQGSLDSGGLTILDEIANPQEKGLLQPSNQ